MAAADSPPTGTVVEKYNKSIEELKKFITSLSADAHVDIKPLITDSINDDDAKLTKFSQDIINALTKLQSENFEGSMVPKYPYAGNAIEEINKIQAAAVAPAEAEVKIEIPPGAKAAGVRAELQWFRFHGSSSIISFKPDIDADKDILDALNASNTKSGKGIEISYHSIGDINYATYKTLPMTPIITCIYTSYANVAADYANVAADYARISASLKSGGKKSRQSRSRNRNRNRNRSNSAHGSKRR